MSIFHFTPSPDITPQQQHDIIEFVARFGYTGIAWNTLCLKLPSKQTQFDQFTTSIPQSLADSLSVLPHNAAFHSAASVFPQYYSPIATTVPTSAEVNTTPTPSKIFSPFQQYSRITVHITENGQISQFNPQTGPLTQFHLIAIQPHTEQILLQALQNNLCDIISLDLSKRIPFAIKPQHSRLAIEKDIYFEVDYTPLFSPDPNIKRNFLQQIQYLIFITRGKQLIFTASSSSTGALHCRKMEDIFALFIAYGVRLDHLRKWLHDASFYTILMHARTRNVNKAVVEVSLAHDTLQFQLPQKNVNHDKIKNRENNNNNGDNRKNNNRDHNKDSRDNKKDYSFKRQKI